MKFRLKDGVSKNVKIKGFSCGRNINKSLLELNEKELKDFLQKASNSTKEKYFTEVKENKKDDKAKKKQQPKAEDTNTGQESKDAPK